MNKQVKKTKEYAVGYVGTVSRKEFYFGEKNLVVSALSNMKNSKRKKENIYSETYTLRYFEQKENMYEYLEQRADFLQGSTDIKFYDLDQGIVAV